ncbi:NADH-quinone oxidoreductase subunit N [Actinocatenispora rupis]|uniref:NADH-quinone oxidoreductase subunit N n=1 Tax=Actinocatenispora rupis TaxID=519421 RepID=A0A8J3J4K4_9ACTN|nr:proton-conducting transporter membrane subunit [Actinocatenispora rupis]GID15686.1 NADH-quinone oxidoreductase subunit N [Actinocatenispora rupis]
MSVQAIDQVALLPAYLAAVTAVAAFVTDLVVPGRRGPVLSVAALGTVATAVAAGIVGAGPRRGTFCTAGGVLPGGVHVGTSCSYVADHTGALVAVAFCAVALAVLGLSVPALRARVAPSGEYTFLVLASLTGGVVLGYSRDLITLVIALETLTLPLYVLVGLRRRTRADDVRGPRDAAAGSVTFFAVSVVSTAVTLLGAALLYGLTGAVHLDRLAAALAHRDDLRHVPLTAAAVLLILVGLAFKVAAVPFHGWAPATYDGAPLPVAAYLSTASKLGGIVALLYVGVDALRPWLDVAGPLFAVLAVATMTVGNLTALRQVRMVRLLAFSSVAQAGYLIAPLGALAAPAGREPAALRVIVAGTLGYTIFYLLLELGAFAGVVALRGADGGGELAEYRGVGRARPVVGAALALALVGLAGLPPGLAGLFAKVTVVRATLAGGAAWLAVVIGLNAVVGLAYYLRVVVQLYRPGEPAPAPRVPVTVGVVLAAVTAAAVVVGFAPQLVLDAAALF